MISDEEILIEYKRTNNNQVLSPLFKKYSDSLFGLAFYYLKNRERAMDAVMDTFEAVLKSLSSKEVQYFKGFIMGICRNLCLKKLRDDKKFVELKEISYEFMESGNDLEHNNEEIEKLITLIPLLKDSQRNCINAFYLKSMSYEDISSAYEYSFKEVKSHIQNGKRNLRILYEKSINDSLNE